MTFREFLNTNPGVAVHLGQKKAHTTVRNKGTSIGRQLSAGKIKNPGSPAGLVSPFKPMSLGLGQK